MDLSREIQAIESL